MAFIASLVSHIAGLTPLTTRLSARLIADPMRYLAGKPFERKLLVNELPCRRLALANDPQIVETVLLDRRGTFPKSAVVEALLRPMIGAGVFGQPGGDAVRSARRLFIQALGRIADEDVSRIARAVTADYIARWRRTGTEVVIPRELSRLTIDIVSQAMLANRFSPQESARFVDLFFTYHKRASPLLLMLAPPRVEAVERLVRHMGLVKIGAQMRSLIRSRFVAPLEASEPDGASAPFARVLTQSAQGGDEAMLDQIAVMLLAGHETTASTLSWLLWELSGRMEIQDTAAFVLGGGDADDKRAGSWSGVAPAGLRAALIDEALRLYPPIAFFLREASGDVTFRGKAIQAGDFVVAAPWTLHRHRENWQDPDSFCPRRWLEMTDWPSQTCYLPFGFGARSCPGQRFAYLEMHEIMQMLLTGCRFSRVNAEVPKPLGSLTSRPDREFALRIEFRSQ